MRVLKVAVFFVLSIAAIASAEKMITGAYESNTFLLVQRPDGSFIGRFYDETVAGKFTCAFMVEGTGKSNEVVTYYPDRELNGGKDDEVVMGTLEVSGTELTLKLPVQAHGGCWNVNVELNDGKPVELSLDTAKPAWKDLRVVKEQKVFFSNAPAPGTQRKGYVTISDVVAVLARKGEWTQIEYPADEGHSSTGWVKDSDLLPATVPSMHWKKP